MIFQQEYVIIFHRIVLFTMGKVQVIKCECCGQPVKVRKLKKAKCPYCGKPLELEIMVWSGWKISARCKACGNKIDFGDEATLRSKMEYGYSS